MLHIKPVTTAYEKEEYSGACGVSPPWDCLCVAAFDNEIIVGASFYVIEGGKAAITDIGFVPGYEDETARILLVKGTLNVIDRSGIADVIFLSPNKDIVRGLGFSEQDGVLRLNLSGYFTDPCDGRDTHPGRDSRDKQTNPRTKGGGV